MNLRCELAQSGWHERAGQSINVSPDANYFGPGLALSLARVSGDARELP